MKQFAKKNQTARTREPSDEQMEEHQTEEHPVSGSEELEQPTNADASMTKSPRKGKRTAKRKRMAQPKERQTANPSGDQQVAEKNAGEQQIAEPSTRKSPRTRSGVQNTASTAQRIGKKKHPANEKSAAKSSSSNSEVISLLENFRQHILLLEDGLMMTMSSEQQATFIEYHASNSQPQDKGKTPATEEETDDDDDDDDDDDENTEEEKDPAQFRLARRRLGSSKVTI
nr:uncharacterized protein DDB_G0286299-like [Coffea arabica]